MDVKSSHLPEGFPTDVAGEWLLARVDPPVNFQDLDRGETLPTGIAGDAADGSVGVVAPDVRRQRSALGERLPAKLTDVWPLPTVDPLVSP